MRYSVDYFVRQRGTSIESTQSILVLVPAPVKRATLVLTGLDGAEENSSRTS